MNAAIALFVGCLLPLAAFWTTILLIRPAIARARVEYEALVIHDRVMDGILADDIDPEDPRALDLLRFCSFLVENSRELSLEAAIAVTVGMSKAGMDPRRDRRPVTADVASGTNQIGSRRLQEAEKELDRALGRFFIQGSSFWWFLGPLQRWYQFARSRNMPAPHEHFGVSDTPRPGELATEVREASRGRFNPPEIWTVHGRLAA